MSSGSSVAIEHESSALAMAILAGNLEEVQMLADIGVTLGEQHYWTLYQACLQGTGMIQALLANPRISLNVSISHNGGDSVFHFVLRTPSTRFYGGKIRVVHTLLEHGANPFEQDGLGEHALHILANIPEQEETGILRALVSGNEPPASINNKNYYGDTPLIVAILCQNFEAVRILLEAGADSNMRGEFGISPMEHAMRQNQMDIGRLLRDFGADPEEDLMLE